MKQENKTLTQKQAIYAKLLIEQGVPYEKILADSAMQGFKPATLRSIKSRIEKRKAATETPQKNEAATQAQHIATPESQPENTPKQPENMGFWREWWAFFHPADLVFYGCVSIGCIGVAQALPVIGVAVAALWFCVAALFLHRTKMFARVGDIVTLALIEILVGVPAHIAWANEALWRNVTALPIEIQLSYGGQMWTGRGIETPFYLACYCAGVLVFFGGAAVAVSTLAVQNQSRKP